MNSNTNADRPTESDTDSQFSRRRAREATISTRVVDGPTALGTTDGDISSIRTIVNVRRERDVDGDGPNFTLKAAAIKVTHEIEDGDESGQLVATDVNLERSDDGSGLFMSDGLRLWHLRAVAAANQAIEDAGLAPDHLLVLPEYVKGLYADGRRPQTHNETERARPVFHDSSNDNDVEFDDTDPNYLPDGGTTEAPGADPTNDPFLDTEGKPHWSELSLLELTVLRIVEGEEPATARNVHEGVRRTVTDCEYLDISEAIDSLAIRDLIVRELVSAGLPDHRGASKMQYRTTREGSYLNQSFAAWILAHYDHKGGDHE